MLHPRLTKLRPYPYRSGVSARILSQLLQKVSVVFHPQAQAKALNRLLDEYNQNPSKFWNKFYSNNKDGFFRDRKWLHLEFPDLVKATEAEVRL